MGIFGYIMMVAFILVWIVLLVKFFRMVSSGKQGADDGDND